MFLGALNGVFMLLVLILAGVLFTRLGLISEDMEHKLSRLCLWAFIPCSLFQTCLNYVSVELLRDMGHVLWLPMAVMLPGYLLGYPAASLLRIAPENRGVFRVMFGLSNSIFIGLPVCLSIFGERALPVVTVYFFSNTLLFWTIGVAGIAEDGGHKYKIGLKALGKIFSPPLIGALLGAAFAILNIRLPQFLLDSVGHVGSMNIPVCLFVTGAILSRMGSGVFKIDRTGAAALAGRLVVQPAIMLLACLAFISAGFMDKVDKVMVTGVFTVESAMPVMAQCMLMAKVYNANDRISAQMLALSSLASVVWIPALAFVLEKIL